MFILLYTVLHLDTGIQKRMSTSITVAFVSRFAKIMNQANRISNECIVVSIISIWTIDILSYEVRPYLINECRILLPSLLSAVVLEAFVANYWASCSL